MKKIYFDQDKMLSFIKDNIKDYTFNISITNNYGKINFNIFKNCPIPFSEKNNDWHSFNINKNIKVKFIICNDQYIHVIIKFTSIKELINEFNLKFENLNVKSLLNDFDEKEKQLNKELENFKKRKSEMIEIIDIPLEFM